MRVGVLPVEAGDAAGARRASTAVLVRERAGLRLRAAARGGRRVAGGRAASPAAMCAARFWSWARSGLTRPPMVYLSTETMGCIIRNG